MKYIIKPHQQISESNCGDLSTATEIDLFYVRTAVGQSKDALVCDIVNTRQYNVH